MINSLKIAITASALAIAATIPVFAGSSETSFIEQIDGAMSKMMTAMDIQPSGDIDKDFVDSMVPHHQGAIDMAEAELRYGHNEKLKRMAQEIVVTQTQEIAAMRQAIGER